MTSKAKTKRQLRDEGFIPVPEVCEELKIAKMKFWRMVRAGRIPEPYKESARHYWISREGFDTLKAELADEECWRANYNISAAEFARLLGWTTDKVKKVYPRGRETCSLLIDGKIMYEEVFVNSVVEEFATSRYVVSADRIREAFLKVDTSLGWLYKAHTSGRPGFPQLDSQKRGRSTFFTERALLEAGLIAQDWRPISLSEFCVMLGGLSQGQLSYLRGHNDGKPGLSCPPLIDGRRFPRERGFHFHYGAAASFARRFLANPEPFLREISEERWARQARNDVEPTPYSDLENLADQYLSFDKVRRPSQAFGAYRDEDEEDED